MVWRSVLPTKYYCCLRSRNADVLICRVTLHNLYSTLLVTIMDYSYTHLMLMLFVPVVLGSESTNLLVLTVPLVGREDEMMTPRFRIDCHGWDRGSVLQSPPSARHQPLIKNALRPRWRIRSPRVLHPSPWFVRSVNHIASAGHLKSYKVSPLSRH